MKKKLEKCISTPITEVTRNVGKYVDYTDSCDKKVGCVIFQEETEGMDLQIVHW